MELNGTLGWFVARGAALLIGVVILLVIYRIGVSAIHRIVPAVITAQATHLPSGSSSDEEVGKRIVTIEDLLRKLLRVGVLAGIVIVALGVFELWAVLAGIVLLIVAVVFATRDVVLDYVMGFLILVEGPYFKGDYLVVNGHPGVEGIVEEIGLRRTLLRDGMGSSAAVSNGFVRLPGNLTRLYSVAVVEFHVLRAGQLDEALATAARVGSEMHADPSWEDQIQVDAPTDVWVSGIGMDGATIRLQQQVRAGTQTAVASEFRRRLAAALVAGSIGTGRWDTPMPIVGMPNALPQAR
ncbi:MAG TPA: mechanosensitive ion channel domain-containing protein [Candidatus Limnocylindria bacterium]